MLKIAITNYVEIKNIIIGVETRKERKTLRGLQACSAVSYTPLDLLDPKSFMRRSKIGTLRLNALNSG